MKKITPCLSLIVLLLAADTRPAYTADSQVPAELRNVGFDQRLNEQVPLDLKFTDDTGAVVKLGDYFGTKPVILVLAYYRCPMLCTLVLNGVVQGMREHAVYCRHGVQRTDGQLRPPGDCGPGGCQEENLHREL